jgi:LysM repeat protein
LPLFAHASVLSFVSGLFGITASAEATDTVSSISSNSQQMPLLEAAVNSNPDSSATTSDPASIVGGNSLGGTTNPAGTTGTTATNTLNSDQITIYTVHAGDTIASVAKLFNVTPNTILWANDLKPGSKITKDQTLVILPISGVEHTVKKGETLKSIASAYKGDISEIIQYNNLPDNATISVGDVIIIPDGEISAAPVTAKNTISTAKTSTKVSVATDINPSAPVQTDSSGNHLADPTGYFMRPISGGVRTQGLHGHNGVDLADAKGTPIMAAAEGDVIISKSSGWNGGYGSYIVISHSNGTQTLYAHLSQNIAAVGDHVTKGQVIGLMGETGLATGYHLHFEVRGGVNPF